MIETKGSSLKDIYGFQSHDTQQGNNKNQNFNDIIVFFVDGGGYTEYAEICELAKKSNKNIYYGATDMLNSNKLI